MEFREIHFKTSKVVDEPEDGAKFSDCFADAIEGGVGSLQKIVFKQDGLKGMDEDAMVRVMAVACDPSKKFKLCFEDAGSISGLPEAAKLEMATLLAEALIDGQDLSGCLEVDSRELNAFKKVVETSLKFVAMGKTNLPDKPIMTALKTHGTIPVKFFGMKSKQQKFVHDVKGMLVDLKLVEAGGGSAESEGRNLKREAKSEGPDPTPKACFATRAGFKTTGESPGSPTGPKSPVPKKMATIDETAPPTAGSFLPPGHTPATGGPKE
ncbi:MAG: hypothetical protein SGARI_005361 [Bacillariaceae sp.]